MIDCNQIKELALASGFKLKEQASGNMDLNSYVYEFAEKLLEDKQREIDELKAKVEKLESLQVDCMIDQKWFMQGTPTSNLIQHAAEAYKAEVVAQNSKIEFGTDDNEHWFAHDVPFFDRVQISRIEEHGLVEWDIYFGECWQGPFDSKSQCIKHLEECIQEKREEEAQGEGHE